MPDVSCRGRSVSGIQVCKPADPLPSSLLHSWPEQETSYFSIQQGKLGGVAELPTAGHVVLESACKVGWPESWLVMVVSGACMCGIVVGYCRVVTM